jgi:hypothetical protein
VENGITSGVTADSFNPGGSCLRAQVVTFLWRAAKQPEPAITTSRFTDVKPTDFFFKPVLWAVENNITSGVSATEFGSFSNCNRAAVVTFLWRAAGSPEPASTVNPFTDVASGSFYEKPVLWAVENGITNGTSATTFGPNEPCNRAQVVTFLWRAAGQTAPTGTDHPFTDVPQGSFYKKAVLWALENGITNGISATEFGAGNPCNRAQVVTFLYRTFQ